MIAGMTYYQICWYFVIYSFAGWVIEVAYHALTLGKVVNRGFLNGPVCPVYGFGILTVFFAGNAGEAFLSGRGFSMESGQTGSLLLLFLGGMILTTAIELVAGWLLDVLFHTRWWDYSKLPLNFRGYICLRFSVIWGIAVVFVVRIVHPIIRDASVRSIPERIGWPLLLVFGVIYLVDLVVTVSVIAGLNRKLSEIDRLRKSMRVVSDDMSEAVAGATMRTATHVREGEAKAAQAKAELKDAAEELHDTIDEKVSEKKTAFAERREAIRDSIDERRENLRDGLAEKQALLRKKRKALTRHPVVRRILMAFPDIRHRDYTEELEELKNSL